ncbi:MAG: winged helix-turn-helix domain-containing protein [Nocardioides sp.]|nr:winged helix-turn-helix domain-containing protein [Nocardioides sp.]
MKPYEDAERVRVSDSAARIAQGHDGKNNLWVRYDLGGWIAQVKAQANAPFDGPEEVSVYLDLSDDDDSTADAIDAADASGGVTAEVLRSVPLNDARKVLRRLRTEVLAKRDEGAYDLPERMTSRDDWMAFARAYALSATRNPQQPIVQLSRATGLSANTINARLRRAQEMGLLERHEGTPWLVLSAEARPEKGE